MQRTTTALLSLLTAGLLAGPAQGASRFVINGAGFGHGVGMSQYGAYGYAKHGKDYRFILAHYFTGTALSQLSSSPTVRVLLQTGSTSFSGGSSASGRRLSAGTTYYVSPTGIGRVALKSSTGKVLKTVDSPLRVSGPGPITLNGAAQNGISGGRYRGVLEFQSTALGFQTVDSVGLEDYVRGVVGAESPTSWPADALKAQAVAARTYAITTGGGANFDQFADTRSQVYKGVAVEVASTESAVAATRGQVVTYGGKPVVTYFFSTSGGRTEDIENSFIGSPAKPWLKSVSDPYDNESPRHRWGPYRYTMAQAKAKLGSYVKGTFRGIDVTQRGESPRVVYADVVGSQGRVRVTGPQLRSIFGLFDTWATYDVITASGQTNNPSGSTTTPGSGDGSGSGGISPGTARTAAVSRTISGRVGWVERPATVTLQRRHDGRWITLFELVTDRHGRYAVGDLARGIYRVRWRGAAGAPVRL
ncbi:MAG: SpoIID/LytB protein [Solirubrobacterales bacterium]|jgi:stage II sporulation protein D|nr:SpoIID/LytB protein [Solirubrobacterales bacterium]